MRVDYLVVREQKHCEQKKHKGIYNKKNIIPEKFLDAHATLKTPRSR